MGREFQVSRKKAFGSPDPAEFQEEFITELFFRIPTPGLAGQ